jgi:uncharacterized phage protein (TIGR01671 family)
MSREIKFRAWDKDEKFMVFQIAGLSECIDVFKFNEWLNSSVYVLMQYTGLKDKNGKEIYEGDILQMDIQWWHKDWSSGKEDKKIKTVGFDMGVGLFHCGDWSVDNEYVEVIGNIYENPELLEAK